MTIRIHEADGTPYEHIVQINQAIQHIEVPYNTKYKRIKRNRKEKERPAKDDDGEYEGDEAGETLLYSLGDVLQSDEDISAWQFKDWDKDDEAKMGNESYEWIRMDVDFEWICKIRLAMPGYMWISQLQQDRDVVAQYEVMKAVALLLRCTADRLTVYPIPRYSRIWQRVGQHLSYTHSDGYTILSRSSLSSSGDSLQRYE